MGNFKNEKGYIKYHCREVAVRSNKFSNCLPMGGKEGNEPKILSLKVPKFVLSPTIAKKFGKNSLKEKNELNVRSKWDITRRQRTQAFSISY